MEKDLLKIARNLYPTGTVFISPYDTNSRYTVVADDYECSSSGIYVNCDKGLKFIYYNGNWGFIVHYCENSEVINNYQIY